MRDERVYLWDMRDSARMILSYARNRTLDDLRNDPMFQDAVIRRLAIIGEAAKKVTPETRARLPELPFSQMGGMRDIIIHVYWGIDLERVWDVVANHLDPLVAAIDRLLPDEPQADPQAP